MLASARHKGASNRFSPPMGFVAMIAGLANEGLATLTREQVKAGGKMIEVGKVRITEAGRDALTGED